MTQIITAKLKLHTDTAQFQALRARQVAYRDTLNYVSCYAFEHGQVSSGRALQRVCYGEFRLRSRLPAPMACNVPCQVGATCKTLWAKAKQNAEARRNGWTKKRYKGLDQSVRFVSPTLTYNYQRDYSFQQEQQVSILSLDGRVVLPYTGYHRPVALIQQGAPIGAAKLRYDTPRKQFYLLVTPEIEVAVPESEIHQQSAGVDIGQRYLAVTAQLDKGVSFFSGRRAKWTSITPARPVPDVGILPMATVPNMACCSSVRVDIIPSMPI